MVGDSLKYLSTPWGSYLKQSDFDLCVVGDAKVDGLSIFRKGFRKEDMISRDCDTPLGCRVYTEWCENKKRLVSSNSVG